MVVIFGAGMGTHADVRITLAIQILPETEEARKYLGERYIQRSSVRTLLHPRSEQAF
jgi:hypothetical protein